MSHDLSLFDAYSEAFMKTHLHYNLDGNPRNTNGNTQHNHSIILKLGSFKKKKEVKLDLIKIKLRSAMFV